MVRLAAPAAERSRPDIPGSIKSRMTTSGYSRCQSWFVASPSLAQFVSYPAAAGVETAPRPSCGRPRRPESRRTSCYSVRTCGAKAASPGRCKGSESVRQVHARRSRPTVEGMVPGDAAAMISDQAQTHRCARQGASAGTGQDACRLGSARAGRSARGCGPVRHAGRRESQPGAEARPGLGGRPDRLEPRV